MNSKYGENRPQMNFQKQQYHGIYALNAYLISFDEMMGPIIVGKSPTSGDEPSSEEISSAVRLCSSFTLDDLIETNYSTGMVNWSDPDSHLYYISFVIENDNLRGGYSLYIIGVNISKDLKQLLFDYSSEIDDFLHNTMNQVVSLMQRKDCKFTNEKAIKNSMKNPDIKDSLDSILKDLRSKSMER